MHRDRKCKIIFQVGLHLNLLKTEIFESFLFLPLLIIHIFIKCNREMMLFTQNKINSVKVKSSYINPRFHLHIFN